MHFFKSAIFAVASFAVLAGTAQAQDTNGTSFTVYPSVTTNAPHSSFCTKIPEAANLIELLTQQQINLKEFYAERHGDKATANKETAALKRFRDELKQNGTFLLQQYCPSKMKVVIRQ